MVETVVHTESEWDEEQVDLAIAFDLVDAEPRGNHGHLLSESVGAQANPDNPDGTHVYRGQPPLVDWAKRAEDDAADEYRDALKAAGLDDQQINAQMRALHFPVMREERKRT